MKRGLLMLRLVVEGLLGLVFVLYGAVDLLKTGTSSGSGAYLLGSLVGIGITFLLGFLLIKDARGIWRRLKAPSPS